MPLVTRFSARAASPADRMAGFMAHLRGNGLRLGVGETAAAMRALCAVDPTDLAQARSALKAVCTGSAEEHARFDDLFDGYWRNRGRARSRRRRESDMPLHHRRNTRKPLIEQAVAGDAGRPEMPDDSEDGAAEQGGSGRLVASRLRNRAKIDLREFFTPADMAAAETTAARLARALRDRRSRRRRPARKGPTPDLRRTLRMSLATGGEPIRLFRKARPDWPVEITVICDVSGSMQAYARVYLALMKGFMAVDRRADAYLFHTRLVRVTEALREGDALKAAGRLSLLAEGFGGGTDIGGALERFTRSYARHRINGRSVVIILSDGYDSGPPEAVGEALARLKKRGCRIVWLNPLKGWAGYAPVARGMASALPHLDLIGAAGTLEGLAALEPAFARL